MSISRIITINFNSQTKQISNLQEMVEHFSNNPECIAKLDFIPTQPRKPFYQRISIVECANTLFLHMDLPNNRKVRAWIMPTHVWNLIANFERANYIREAYSTANYLSAKILREDGYLNGG